MSDNSNYNISSRSYTMPRGLMALNFLSQTEKQIINRIIGLSAKYINKGGCTLSNGAMAETEGCTTGTVSVAISKAAWLGFVTKREDTLDRYENGNGTTAITQTRRIVMTIPDFFEYLGELWGEGYYAQNKDAREILKQVNILLAEAFKKSSKENNGVEIAINSLLSCLLTEDGIQDYLNTPKRNIFCPPKEKSLGPLIKNPSLFKFWETKVLGNQSSRKLLHGCSLHSHPQKSDGDKKEKKIDDVIPRKRRKSSEQIKEDQSISTASKNIPYNDILKSWNEIVKDTPIPTILKLTPERKTKIKSRFELLSTLSEWEDLFKKVIKIPFYCGDGDRGWICTFDYLVKNDNNIVKILESKSYDSKPKRSSQSENPHTKQSEFLNNDPGKFKNIVVEKFIS